YLNKTDVVQVINSNNYLFFWAGRNEKRRGISHFALQYIGPRTWSERFRYSVTMRTLDDKQTLTEHSNTTHYHDNTYEVMRVHKCTWFYNDFISMCLDPYDTLWLDIDAQFISLDKEMPDKEIPENIFV
ncbi:hypothetical protein L9F63_027049, partial [Diploptera punctata]